MPELVDLLSEVVNRIDALFVEQVAAEHPARVERVERTLHGECVAVAVARVRESGVEAHAAAEQVRVAVAQYRFVAVEQALFDDLNLLARAEQVPVVEADGPLALAAAMRELELGRERPGVADAHVDGHGVRNGVVAFGADLHVCEIASSAQRASGFVEHAGLVAIADLEQQRALDDRVVRADVHFVGPAIERFVFLWIARVEHVVDRHVDLADRGAGLLELRIEGCSIGRLEPRLVLTGCCFGRRGLFRALPLRRRGQ